MWATCGCMCACLAKVEGEIGKEMFIIETGMVEAYVGSESCRHAKGKSTCPHCVVLGRQGPKSFFGELAVMGVREWQRRYAADATLGCVPAHDAYICHPLRCSHLNLFHRRRRSVRAKTDCNLSVLRKSVLDELRYDYPELNEQLFRVASQSENGLGGGRRQDAHITSIDEEHVEPATKHDVHQLAARVDGLEGKLDQVIAMLEAAQQPEAATHRQP